MDDSAALDCLRQVLVVLERWAKLYDQRWGYDAASGHREHPHMESEVDEGYDEVVQRVRLARDVVAAMGESVLAGEIAEHGQAYGHPYGRARNAIVEAIGVLEQRAELARIVGPQGPRMSASELHRVIWGSAAPLWDDGHHRQAVQTAAVALEGILQTHAGPDVSGADLANLFSTKEPKEGSPRLRIEGLEPGSKTWSSAHEGAASLVRGAFMGVRNLVLHPGHPDLGPTDALEMLAVLSYVARLVDRSDLVE